MVNRPSIVALLWSAGLALAGGCTSSHAVLHDRHGWPVPTYALDSVVCYRYDGNTMVWWDRFARQERAGSWTCEPGTARRIEGPRPDDVVATTPPPAALPPEPPPARPDSAIAAPQPVLDTVR